MKLLDLFIDPEKYLKKVRVGNYIYGFDVVAIGTLNPFVCCVTEKDLVFKAQSGMGRKIGRIPRDKITQIEVENKMHDTKRVTASRLLLLGIFAFAAQKKEKIGGFGLNITWDDNGKREAVFEFIGPLANSDANKALTTLRSFIKK